MTMPRFGSRSICTSQKLRIVLTPAPSGCGHIIIAGSLFLAAGFAGAAGDGVRRVVVPRDWAPRVVEQNSAAARSQLPAWTVRQRPNDRLVLLTVGCWVPFKVGSSELNTMTN